MIVRFTGSGRSDTTAASVWCLASTMKLMKASTLAALQASGPSALAQEARAAERSLRLGFTGRT